MIKITNKKRLYIFLIGIVLVAIGIFFVVYKNKQNEKASPSEMSLSLAATIGEKKIYQLLIKINSGSDQVGGFQRGDIVLIAPEDKEFSIAEQTGFLIIKMNLTETQTQLFVSAPLEAQENMKNIDKDKEEKPVENKNQNIRRVSVDLEKIGIPTDEQKGRVISDKVFQWNDIVIEKK